MKKYTVLAVPVAIALLTFCLAGKSMAFDAVVPIADDGSTAVGVNDTLNGNKVLNDDVSGKTAANDQSIAASDILNGNTVSDIANDKSKNFDQEVEQSKGDYNAVAGIGNATVDKSITVKIEDIRVAVATSTLSGAVSGNKVIFGNGLEMEAKGNRGGSAINASLQANKASQKNGALGANGALQGNGALQASGALQGNGASQDRDATATSQNESFGSAKATGLDAAYGKNESEAANLALGANKAEGENKAYGENSAKQANASFQAANATTGDYTATQDQVVYLATGANNLAGGITANGINSISMNSGINALFQQSVNVQASIYNTPAQ
ncbi:MAG: hypothetical protein VB050_04000 [Geobacteraceae bacterium]|nr:hypothetical protein [Geobacteraceae bacterium]